MNKTAILATAARNDEGQPMLLAIPRESGYSFYYRVNTGSRGRGAAWRAVSSKAQFPDAALDRTPLYVPVTDRDLSLATAGQVTSVNVKAMKALDASAVADTDGSLHATFEQLFEAPVAGEITAKAPNISVTTVEQPKVALATVPDSKWAAGYLNRKILGNLTEFDIYDAAMRDGDNVLITGHAGSGKTMSVMAYAASRGYRYYNVSSHNGQDHTQLMGHWIPTPEATFRWQDGPVTDCVRNGNAVLLLNEINFMPEKLKTLLFSLLDKRREIQLMDKDGEVVKAAPNLLIVADMNPNYRGTKPLNEAEKDRYAHKLEFGYDATIERKLIKSKALLEIAARLRHSFEREEIITPVSTRSLVAFMDNARNLGIDYAMYSYVNGFHESERNAVRLAVETAKANIAADLGQDVVTLPLQDDEATFTAWTGLNA